MHRFSQKFSLLIFLNTEFILSKTINPCQNYDYEIKYIKEKYKKGHSCLCLEKRVDFLRFFLNSANVTQTHEAKIHRTS